jgi:TatA/E family protein of Tat protein translocase
MFDVGGGELLLIVLVVLFLFGPKKIPEVAQMLGKGLRQFRKAQEDLTQQIRDISAETASTSPQVRPYVPPPTLPTDPPVPTVDTPPANELLGDHQDEDVSNVAPHQGPAESHETPDDQTTNPHS